MDSYSVKNTNFPNELYNNLKKTSKISYLKYYQSIVLNYMNNLPYGSRGLLIYHAMGMGKTILAIAIAMELISKKQILLLMTKSLHYNMESSIYKYCDMRRAVDKDWYIGKMNKSELDVWIKNHFKFVTLNASNMMKQFNKHIENAATKELDSMLETKYESLNNVTLDNKHLIVDEAHNFFKSITNGSKNAINLYESIMKSKDLTMTFLSGTPLSSSIFESVPCFNMLSGNYNLFPNDYFVFNELFVKDDKIINKSVFQNRIHGLVSYVSESSALSHESINFPEERPLIIEKVKMNKLQYLLYSIVKEREDRELTFLSVKSSPLIKPKSENSTSYKVNSRQFSNYFYITDLKKYNLNNEETDELYKKLPFNKFKKCLENINKYPNRINLVYSQFLNYGLIPFAKFLDENGFEEYKVDFNSIVMSEDTMQKNLNKETKYDNEVDTEGDTEGETEGKDNEVGKTDTEGKDNEGKNNEVNKKIVNNKINTEGKTKDIEGNNKNSIKDGSLDITGYFIKKGEYDIPEYIKADTTMDYLLKNDINDYQLNNNLITEKTHFDNFINNYKLGEYKNNLSEERDRANNMSSIFHGTNEKKRKYVIISGDVKFLDRNKISELLSDIKNIHGEIVELVLVSSTGTEGLDLKGLASIHILEPYFTYNRIKQIIARGVRHNSHINLDKKDQYVQPYIYFSTYENKICTDEEVYDSALKKYNLIMDFLMLYKEVSIECNVGTDKGIDCVKCIPNNKIMYSNDIFKDVKEPNKCISYKKVLVDLKEIVYNNNKYYYKDDNNSIYEYAVYNYDNKKEMYVRLKENDPRLQTITNLIIEKSNKQ